MGHDFLGISGKTDLCNRKPFCCLCHLGLSASTWSQRARSSRKEIKRYLKRVLAIYESFFCIQVQIRKLATCDLSGSSKYLHTLPIITSLR